MGQSASARARPVAPVAKPVGAKNARSPRAKTRRPPSTTRRGVAIVARFAGETLARVEARVYRWVLEKSRRTSRWCASTAGAARRIDMPPGSANMTSTHVAVDGGLPRGDARRAALRYSVDLAQGTMRWRVAIHDNNGPVGCIAWVVDDLWAVRCVSQLLLFDLSEKDAVFVATQQPYGSLLRAFATARCSRCTPARASLPRRVRLADPEDRAGVDGAARAPRVVGNAGSTWATGSDRAGRRRRGVRVVGRGAAQAREAVPREALQAAEEGRALALDPDVRALPPEPLYRAPHGAHRAMQRTSSADLHGSGDAVVVTMV